MTSVMDIGLLTMLPYMLAVVAMLVAARSSDKHRERLALSCRSPSPRCR